MKPNKIALFFISILVFLLTFFIAEYPKYRSFNDGLLRIYFLDVGQGDSTLIKLPSQKLVLIDAGPNSRIGELISANIPFYKNTIDLVVVSHSHADHITGLLDVLENYHIKCMIYDMQDDGISETETYLREQLEIQQVKIISTSDVLPDKILPPDCFKDENVELMAYSLLNIGNIEEDKVRNNQNLESNIIMLKYKGFEALFTADAEVDVQSQLLYLLVGNIEILKVPHQGSFDGFYVPLLQKLSPDYAVFSVGESNSYGHPHKEVTEGYNNLGIKFSRTDQNGTVQVKTDGSKWGVTLEKLN